MSTTSNENLNDCHQHKNIGYIPAIDKLPKYSNINCQSISLMGDNEPIQTYQKLVSSNIAKVESISSKLNTIFLWCNRDKNQKNNSIPIILLVMKTSRIGGAMDFISPYYGSLIGRFQLFKITCNQISRFMQNSFYQNVEIPKFLPKATQYRCF